MESELLIAEQEELRGKTMSDGGMMCTCKRRTAQQKKNNVKNAFGFNLHFSPLITIPPIHIYSPRVHGDLCWLNSL